MTISKEKFDIMSDASLFDIASFETDKYYRFFRPFKVTKEEYYDIIMSLIKKTRSLYTYDEDYTCFLIHHLNIYIEKVNEDKDYDGEKAYINQARQFDKLTDEEEMDCIIRAKAGDREAKEKLINANLSMVTYVAMELSKIGLSYFDVIQEGNIALISAIDNYDINKGFRFSTYAEECVKKAMIRANAKDGRLIRLPIYTFKILKRINESRIYLTQKNNREPRPDEIAENIGVPIEIVEALIIASEFPLSLNDTIASREKATLEDFIEDRSLTTVETIVARIMLKENVEKFLSTLGERDKNIIILLYGLNGEKGKTLDAVGQKYNISRERVRQLKNSVFDKIKTTKWNKIFRVTDQLDPIGGKVDYSGLVKDDDTIESLINKLIGFLPKEDIRNAMIFFDNRGIIDGIAKRGKELVFKYDCDIDETETIIERIARKISENAQARYLYFAILRKIEESLSEEPSKEANDSYEKPTFKVLRGGNNDEKKQVQKLMKKASIYFMTPEMDEIITEELFESMQNIAKILKLNYESDKPKSINEIMFAFGFDIKEIEQTIITCLNFYTERVYGEVVDYENTTEYLLAK